MLNHGLIDDKCDKARALLVNDALIERALFQEQQIIVARLKLRVLHKHPDVCAAQKAIIRGLKDAIARENRRIAILRA
jgi:hypothetical protein